MTTQQILQGIHDWTNGKIVYDISVAHPDGQGNPTPYANLKAALGNGGANIPEPLRKGGMSVKFIKGSAQSSDNKYVQFRCKTKDFSANPEDWAICDDSTLVECPEYIAVYTDADGKIILAVENDGNIHFGTGVPKQVIDYITAKIAELSLDEYEDIVAFLNDLEKGDKTLQDLFNEKVDKEEGKSLIDTEYASSQSTTDSSEHIQVTTDSEGKILAGRTPDGAAFENVGFSTPKVSIDGHTIENVEDPEGRTEMLTDSEGKIVSYRDAGGVKHENVGIELGAEALKSFKEMLNIVCDWSDKDSIYIPEPRLAHLNIITNFNLTTLSKTSDVPVTVEFYDGAGNYFKKYGILNGQGRSSLSFVKKGLGMDFFNENPTDANFDEDNTFKMKFGDWIPQDSFHIKSFYTDWPRCTTPIVYKLTDEVVRTRGVMKDRPYKKYYVGEYSDAANANTQSKLDQNMETGARCFPDGFPVIVYQNGEFWGVNAWQLKKHRDNYMLNKKKDTNIHLDGDMGTTKGQTTPFWLYDGNIDWNAYCSGTGGIETRNPKNLYCVDGKKYDADTHDEEIIDTATAETWIAAGQIIPTGKTIDEEIAGYLRTTGKVKKNIEDLTTYVPYIQGLIDGGSSTADIKAAIADRFDVDSFIDYIVVGNVVGNTDAWDNNGQIVTWGKLSGSSNLNWSVNVYDCDLTFGCRWDGLYATAADSSKLGSNYPLYKFFWSYYYDELKARYQELRDKGIFDAEHITGLFRDWMDRVGYDNYKKEFAKWPESPCFRNGSQTYTLYPTTGGMYGSIERIYLWIKKRIEYMDAADFFNYNQN